MSSHYSAQWVRNKGRLQQQLRPNHSVMSATFHKKLRWITNPSHAEVQCSFPPRLLTFLDSVCSLSLSLHPQFLRVVLSAIRKMILWICGSTCAEWLTSQQTQNAYNAHTLPALLCIGYTKRPVSYAVYLMHVCMRFWGHVVCGPSWGLQTLHWVLSWIWVKTNSEVSVIYIFFSYFGISENKYLIINQIIYRKRMKMIFPESLKCIFMEKNSNSHPVQSFFSLMLLRSLDER